jgi:hypothetical protein
MSRPILPPSEHRTDNIVSDYVPEHHAADDGKVSLCLNEKKLDLTNKLAKNATYPGLELILNSVANWVMKYRYACGIRDQLIQCGPDDVASIARDLGLSANELETLASKGPEAANLLQKMLIALGVDSKSLAFEDPLIMRDLQRLCITCGHKGQCERDLAAGTAVENYKDYCPNAYGLDIVLGTA